MQEQNEFRFNESPWKKVHRISGWGWMPSSVNIWPKNPCGRLCSALIYRHGKIPFTQTKHWFSGNTEWTYPSHKIGRQRPDTSKRRQGNSTNIQRTYCAPSIIFDSNIVPPPVATVIQRNGQEYKSHAVMGVMGGVREQRERERSTLARGCGARENISKGFIEEVLSWVLKMCKDKLLGSWRRYVGNFKFRLEVRRWPQGAYILCVCPTSNPIDPVPL